MDVITNRHYRWVHWFLIAAAFVGLVFQAACQPPASQPGLPSEEIIVTVAPTIEPAQLPPATISSLEIYMDVRRGTVLLNNQPFTSGVIKEGDVIATGADGFAWLYFYGDKLITVDVKPNTRLWVEKITPETARLFLEVGSLLNKVRSNYGIYFMVATKAVEVTAKGTDFGTEVDPEGNVEVTGLDGEVEVRSTDGSTTTVGEDQKVDVSTDGKLGPVQNIIPIVFDFGYEDLADTDYAYTNLYREDESGFSTFRQVIEQAGYDLQVINDLNDLDLFRVLLLMAPDFSLQDWEIQTIQAWVDSGHGLFVMGELPVGYDWVSVNALLTPYGIVMTGENLPYGGKIEKFPLSHPVIASTKTLGLGSYGPLQGGLGLGYDQEDRLVISAYEGIGRVLVFADASVFTNRDIVYKDEIIFLQDALKWLAGPGN